MAPTDYFAWAEFRFMTGDGRQYEVAGQPETPQHRHVPVWQAFVVDVQPSDASGASVQKWFIFTRQLGPFAPLGPDQDKDQLKLSWLRALRRYALDCTTRELNKGGISESDELIGAARHQEVSQWLHKQCDLQGTRNGDLICTADRSGDPATTVAVCERCVLPDPWERCAHLCHLRTTTVVTEHGGMVKRHATGQCQLGMQPCGNIPEVCRAGPRPPQCFEPATLTAPLASRHLGLRPPEAH